MKNILTIIWKIKLPLLLIAIIGVLCAANYTPGTWLSGWDTLHPEWNFSLAFSRMLDGVWRTDQGLGTVAIQSHMADLPRVVWLWILSFALPTSFLRYSYFFLMLLVGPLGMYALAKKMKIPSTGAFIGALFYLCNLGTLQQFIVPLEMFATLYGFFPWLILTAINVVKTPTKRSSLWFALLSLVSSSMAQTATLFYAYIAMLCLFVITYATQLPLTVGHKIRRILIVLTIALLTNAFWLFPNIYAAVTHGKEVQESKVNQLFSPEALAKNQAFGNLNNAVILKNFLFDWSIYSPQKETFVDLMAPWKQHLQQRPVQWIGISMFLVSLIGIITTVVKKQKIGIALLPVWIVGFLMLLSGTSPITGILAWVTKTFPLAGEALRFPFTKFSILYMLPFAVFGGMGAATMIAMYKNKLLQILFSVEISLAVLAFMLPAFTGNLIHPAMRITYPTAYQEMFTWFSTQNKNERVSILPNHTFWNWSYYNWGYQGAGFLQFGIPQPILDRDYDRWNIYNEQYQRELSYAIYSKQPLVIRTVLEKYNVTWVLLDASVIAPGDNKNTTLSWQLPDLLAEAGLEKEKTFGDTISIYRVTTKQTDILQSVPKAVPLEIGEPFDITYATYGNYQTTIVPTLVNKDARNSRTLRAAQEIPTILDPVNTLIDANTPLLVIPLATLDHAKTYMLTIYSQNKQGFPPQFCLLNDLTKRCDIFTRLTTNRTATEDQFLLPKLEDYGTGYTILLKNETIGTTPGSHLVNTIAVSEIPWQIANEPTATTDTIITNNASYESGWRAYKTITPLQRFFPILFGTQLPNHVMVNSWENGWILTDKTLTTTNITFVYMPQYLETLGAFCLIILVGLLALPWRKRI